MAREPIEFQCNDCSPYGYFIVNLNFLLEGNFLFVCPKCGREHPRNIKNGEMFSTTEVKFIKGKGNVVIKRFSESKPTTRIIVPMSSWSQTSRIELLKGVKCGYMEERWMRKAAEEKGMIDALEGVEERASSTATA